MIFGIGFKSFGSLVNRGQNGQCFSENNNSDARGWALIPWACKGKAGQTWTYITNTEAYGNVRVINGATYGHICSRQPNAVYACVATLLNLSLNTQTTLYGMIDRPGQLFTFVTVGNNGYYQIKNGWGKCLGIGTNGFGASIVVVWDCDATIAYQQWKFA